MIMGTVAYLSPEQVTTGTADARSDVYAAGVLLYELLTGEPPLRRRDGDLGGLPARELRRAGAVGVAGDVPPELDRLVQRATRRDPAQRPADAAALLAELRDVAELLEVPRVAVPVPPVPPPEEQDTLPNSAQRLEPGRAGAAGAGRHPDPPATRRRGARRPRRAPDHRRAGAAPAGPAAQRRLFAVWTAVVLALAVGVAVSAWWLGSGRWTAMRRCWVWRRPPPSGCWSRPTCSGCRSGPSTTPPGGPGHRGRPGGRRRTAARQHGHLHGVGRAAGGAGHRPRHRRQRRPAGRPDAGLDPVDGPESSAGPCRRAR
jgi:hypothetical protein